MPPYDSVFGAVGGGGSKAGKKDGGNWPSTPTPKSWGATPTPSGAAPASNFGLHMPPPPMPMMSFMPPGFAAMAHMAATAATAAGAAAGAAAAAAAAAHMSPDCSPEAWRPHHDQSGRRHNKHNEASYAVEAYESPPWNMQPGMPLPPGPPPMNTLAGGSKGSSTHGSGKCRPCAWFWKPDGCQSGLDCNYCHLCPEGELKSRKKLKVAAMRMGALTPAKPGSNAASSARTLKLTSLV